MQSRSYGNLRHPRRARWGKRLAGAGLDAAARGAMFGLLLLSPPLYAAPFTIVNGQVETSGQTLNDNETGTINAGGQLNVTGANAVNVAGDNASFSNGGAVTTDFAVLVTALASDNATLVNDGSMTISGNARTVALQGNNHQFTNNGSVTAPALAVQAVYFTNGSGSTLSNNGTISSNRDDGNGAAVQFGIPNATLVNTGTISSTGYSAVFTNNVAPNLTITNSGTISTTGANDHAIRLGSASTVTNSSGGTVSANGAGAVAIDLALGAVYSVTNGGSISAATSLETAISDGAGNSTLVLQPGSAITGLVDFGGGTDVFELGGTTGSGSFDSAGLGVQYLNFDTYRKAGASTWGLTGTNAAAIPWAVDGGTLQVNGAIANSTITVNAGGTLGGTGTVGDIAVPGAGAIAPGASIGTLNSGNVTLTGASNLNVEVTTPGNNDLLAITGNLTLDGTLNITNLGGLQTGSYTLITYTGALTDNGLVVAPVAGHNFSINAGAGVVELVVLSDTYNLTYNAGANGSLGGTTSQTVVHGLNGSAVTAIPAAGYQFSQWSDGSTANPRTDLGVTAAVNVTAQFVLLPVTPIIGTAPTADAGGNITRISLDKALTITLDGTGSHDPESALEYRWIMDNSVIAKGPTLELTLANGAQYLIALLVTDADGNDAYDRVNVTLNYPDELAYHGVPPDPDLALGLNSIGYYDSASGLLYTCAAAYDTDGEPLNDRTFDITLAVLEPVAFANHLELAVLDIARRDNDGLVTENGEPPDCSGMFFPATLTFEDYLSADGDTGFYILKLVDLENLVFRVVSYEAVTAAD